MMDIGNHAQIPCETWGILNSNSILRGARLAVTVLNPDMRKQVLRDSHLDVRTGNGHLSERGIRLYITKGKAQQILKRPTSAQNVGSPSAGSQCCFCTWQFTQRKSLISALSVEMHSEGGHISLTTRGLTPGRSPLFAMSVGSPSA